jgi:hypothetical protein
MFMSSDGGQDAGVSTRLPKSNGVGGVQEKEGCVEYHAMVIYKGSGRNVDGSGSRDDVNVGRGW